MHPNTKYLMVKILAGIVWTPDPSGHARKGLGNNFARKCLAGMPRFLNPANFIFRSSTRLVRYYSNFQNFYALLYIHFLSLVELKRWLAEMRSFPHQHRRQHSSAQDTSGQGYSPDPSSRGQKDLGSRLSWQGSGSVLTIKYTSYLRGLYMTSN